MAMRRFLTPSTIVPALMLAALAAMVVSANIREGRSSERPSTVLPPLGAPGALTSRQGLDHRIADMEARLTARPGDAGAAALLVDALVRQSRVTGSMAAMMRAQTVLTDALRQAPAHYDLLHAQAVLHLARHEFAEAIAVAESCWAQRPKDASVYGILGDAHLELGDYDEAFDAFDEMMQLRPNAASYARVAYARELQGNLTGALEAMTLAAEATGGGDLEGIAWTRSQVGELYLRLDQPATAMREFAIASQAFPGHPFAVAGYARALEAQGKFGDAIALLQQLVATSPTPDVHVQLAELLAREGRQNDADRHYALAEAAWRSDAPEPKNLARFLADRGAKIGEAVAIAERAAAARHDIFTEDALAWAYFKAGRVEDARRLIARARRTGTKDRQILRHAAAIEARARQVG